ncbi:MAG TPA: M64 family metallopeptidase, partial [Nocardioidaceae bacterium]|nr:M64 family metallopeptidase [Nocardioidaceae bacterium]
MSSPSRLHLRLLVVGSSLLVVAALLGVVDQQRSVAQTPADDGEVTPLQVTGPPEESLNLVVLGDGYTADEIDDFHADVDKHLNVLWSIEPFRSYRNYVNVYRVDVVSKESGISCDPDDGNVRRDTALSLEYAQECPAEPNARGVTFGDGGEEALEAYVDDIPGITPQNRQTLTL